MIVIRTADGDRHLYDSDLPPRMFPEVVHDYDQTFGSKVVSLERDGSVPFWTRPDDMDYRIEAMIHHQADEKRLARVRAALPDLQLRCALWRTAKDKATWVPPTSLNVAYKAWEESGEFGRAVLGIEENRTDRGDPFQEAAQVVLVLLTWFGIHHPDRDLLTEVLDEMERAGA